MTSWPLSSTGLDLSDIANHREQIGLFAHGSYEPWMAVYKPKFHSGVAHYADPNEVRGKKLWLWGDADKGVKEARTENFNSYVEMQAGLFETQPEFAFLIPEASLTFTHYWIPFHGLNGISRATPDGVINIARTGNSATIELQATHSIKNARIRLSGNPGARVLLETDADLDPKVIWSKVLEKAPPHFAVDVLSNSGEVIFHHVEGEIGALSFDPTAPNPEPVPPSDKDLTEAGFLERGLYDEQRDRLAFAWREFTTGIAKFRSSLPLLEGAARVASTLNRYEDAIKILTPLTVAERFDPASHYYYGVALEKTGSNKLAKDAFSVAARNSVWAPAADLQLALLAAREHDMETAVKLMQVLGAKSRADERIGTAEIALLRLTGNLEKAKERLQFWSDRDPANNMLRVERSMLENADDPQLWVHLAADSERVLDVVDQYLEIGAVGDALKLLDRRYPAVPATEMEKGKVLPQDNPLIAYYRGYCRLLLHQDAAEDFKAAETLSTRYIFPHRASSYAVLKAALAADKSDAIAHDLLGDLYFDSLDTDRAITEWKQALALKRDLPALHRNLGRALLEVKGDSVAAKQVLLEGVTMEPRNADTAAALGRATSIAASVKLVDVPKLPAAELRISTPSVNPPAQVASPSDSIAFANAALIRSASESSEAASMFTADKFPREKQPDVIRRAWIEVQLQRVLTLARAGKCDDALPGLETLGDEDENLRFTVYGFGGFMKAPHFQYYRGVIESICGDEKAAKKTWSKLSKPTDSIMSVEDVFPYLALLNSGASEAKQKIAAALANVKSRVSSKGSNPDLIYAEAVLSVASGKRKEGLALLEQSASAPDPLVQYLSLVALKDLIQK
jgi:tetratricopeptide (TPR) repeat protein